MFALLAVTSLLIAGFAFDFLDGSNDDGDNSNSDNTDDPSPENPEDMIQTLTDGPDFF
jgi:hypothetical protein